MLQHFTVSEELNVHVLFQHYLNKDTQRENLHELINKKDENKMTSSCQECLKQLRTSYSAAVPPLLLPWSLLSGRVPKSVRTSFSS